MNSNRNINRREFVSIGLGLSTAAIMAGFPAIATAAKKKVVIVGGGVAGATAAKYLLNASNTVDVTLIEPKKTYHTCFLSNLVLSGERKLSSIEFGYEALKKRGLNLVHDYARQINPDKKKVITKKGQTYAYDACIVAPGIGFDWEAIEGYDKKAAEIFPHAYQAGAQTRLLQRQLHSINDGGVMIIVAPPNPFRCPPGPYERASQIAWYFKKHKPKSKILILDAKPKFSKMALFEAGWEKYYGYNSNNSMIEWISGPDGGEVSRVDVNTKLVYADSKHKGAVVNVIPPQKAGNIAFRSDLVDETGWCPVNHRTFESLMHKNVYVIGDASIAAPMPKSGYAANSQAKSCAAAVLAQLNNQPPPMPSYVNTCYSLITPEDGISVAMVYKLNKKGKIAKVANAGGVTPLTATADIHEREAAYARSWFKNITHDIFG